MFSAPNTSDPARRSVGSFSAGCRRRRPDSRLRRCRGHGHQLEGHTELVREDERYPREERAASADDLHGAQSGARWGWDREDRLRPVMFVEKREAIQAAPGDPPFAGATRTIARFQTRGRSECFGCSGMSLAPWERRVVTTAARCPRRFDSRAPPGPGTGQSRGGSPTSKRGPGPSVRPRPDGRGGLTQRQHALDGDHRPCRGTCHVARPVRPGAAVDWAPEDRLDALDDATVARIVPPNAPSDMFATAYTREGGVVDDHRHEAADIGARGSGDGRRRTRLRRRARPSPDPVARHQGRGALRERMGPRCARYPVCAERHVERDPPRERRWRRILPLTLSGGASTRLTVFAIGAGVASVPGTRDVDASAVRWGRSGKHVRRVAPQLPSRAAARRGSGSRHRTT